MFQNLGIREEFAYHTLLYHNIFEVRRIFISLIEKLPKESVFQEVTLSMFTRTESKSRVLFRSIGTASTHGRSLHIPASKGALGAGILPLPQDEVRRSALAPEQGRHVRT